MLCPKKQKPCLPTPLATCCTTKPQNCELAPTRSTLPTIRWERRCKPRHHAHRQNTRGLRRWRSTYEFISCNCKYDCCRWKLPYAQATIIAEMMKKTTELSI